MKYNTQHLFALDIETVPFTDFNEQHTLFPMWAKKHRKENLTTEQLIEKYFTDAGLYPTFSKICCISVGIIHSGALYLKSFCGEDEKLIIDGFLKSAEKFQATNGRLMTLSYNALDFDLPVLRKRYAKYYAMFSFPSYLSDLWHKPWTLEESHVDLMKIFKGTSFHFSSLAEVATLVGLPNPKESVDGSGVFDLYKAGRFDEIATYCEGDVKCTVDLFCNFSGIECFPLPNVQQQTKPTEEIPIPNVPLLTKLINTGKLSAAEKAKLAEAIEPYKDKEGWKHIENAILEVFPKFRF